MSDNRLKQKLTALGNATRSCTGKTAKMTIEEMAAEINGIYSNWIIDGFMSRTITGDITIGLPNLGTGAVQYCRNLKSITLPNVSSCGNSAFYECTALETADFGAATTFGNNAFTGCTSLTAVVIRATTAPATLNNSNAFTRTPIADGTGYIYVPDDLVDAYKMATNWSVCVDQIKPLSEYEEV